MFMFLLLLFLGCEAVDLVMAIDGSVKSRENFYNLLSFAKGKLPLLLNPLTPFLEIYLLWLQIPQNL